MIVLKCFITVPIVFQMKTCQTIPVSGTSQCFLSIKLYTQETLCPITNKQEVKKMLTDQLKLKNIRSFTVKVVQYKYLLAYVNFQRSQVRVNVCFYADLTRTIFTCFYRLRKICMSI